MLMTMTDYEQINRRMIEAGELYRHRPPAGMRPDRPEVMAEVGSGPREVLAPGVEVQWLVGVHNRARNLATGLLTLAPSAGHDPHRHHVPESVTVLRGDVIAEVENRRHELGPLDNLVIPPGLNHRLVNAGTSDAAELHVAFPLAAPTSTPGQRQVKSDLVPRPRQVHAGIERVNRFATAERYQAAPNARFVQFFSSDLVPGISMCGGYGEFLPGGRLPAHLHDCDESICIIAGVATCWVEGRRYQLRDRATALQPRGRVHYFVNDTREPMAMIWVYANPTTARVVVDERCAVEPNVAWPAKSWQEGRR